MRHDTDNGLLHDAVQVLFVELSKLGTVLKKPVEEMTDMERISVFLRYAEYPDYREIVNKVIESKEGLVVAGKVLMNISKDEREQAILRNRRIALADLESNLETAKINGINEGMNRGITIGRTEGITIGRTEGKAEGKAEGILEVAKNLLSAGVPIETVLTATGLTRKEIESLRKADQ
jgi:predicted transposase/invertase (TIGR01784 family)